MIKRLAIILICLLISCSFRFSKPSASPTYGGQLRGVFSSDILNWDPAFAVDTKTGHLISLVYSNLFRYAPDSLQLEPELVDNWYVDSTGLIYYFKLHEGVYFTDGTELTAEDVVYSWNRLLAQELNSPRDWLLQDVSEMQVLGKYELMIILAQPSPAFLFITSLPNLAIVSKANQSLKTRPVGSGAWILTEWSFDEKLRFSANDDYFLGRPYLDELVFYILQGLPAYFRFESGELDWMFTEPEILPRWQRLYSTRLHPQEKANTFYVGLTNTKAPFHLKEVRQALNYATDQESIIKYLLQNTALAALGPVPPVVGGVTQITYGFDLEKAIRLLERVDLKEGFTMDLWVAHDPLLIAVAQVLQQQWAKINIKVNIVQSDFAGLQQATTGQGIDSFLMGWSMDFPLVENFLVPTFARDNWGASGNRVFFKDELFEQLISERQWGAAEKRIIELAPWVFLWHGIEITAVQPWVKNWQTHASYYGLEFSRVWLDHDWRE